MSYAVKCYIVGASNHVANSKPPYSSEKRKGGWYILKVYRHPYVP